VVKDTSSILAQRRRGTTQMSQVLQSSKRAEPESALTHNPIVVRFKASYGDDVLELIIEQFVLWGDRAILENIHESKVEPFLDVLEARL
jgi:hypothetical protein